MAQNYALKFISGKYQGGEFPLLSGKEIVVGRSSELDMVLVEDMVSRKHAKITSRSGQVVIQDLGSTNGTFVNGEKIKKTRLKDGDRILIGTSILKLVPAHGDAADVDETEARAQLEALERSSSVEDAHRSDMTGRLDEVPVPDLLQLFSTSKRTGVLHIRSAAGYGKIYLRDGNVFYASIDDDHELGPMKAVCRVVGWEEGTFEFGAPEEADFVLELEDSTEALLAEAQRQNTEFRQIAAEIPGPRQRLLIPRPLDAPLSSLGPQELDVIQLVHNLAFTQKVLDRSPATDYETAQALLNLMAQGYVSKR